MMIGVAFSRGWVSMRVTPSIWVGISSSAGSDIGPVLLCGWNLGCGRGFRQPSSKKRCERRDFVGSAFHADNRRAVDIQCRAHRGGKPVEVTDVDGRQAREHRRETGTQVAGAESVVAVEVVIEQLLA